MFLLYTYGKNCSIGTNVSANSTVKVAKSFLKTNGRLHYACQTILHKSRFQDMRRAFADTKMTGCTLLLKVFPTDRSRRSDWIFLFVCLLPSSLATDSLAWDRSLGAAPAVTRPATKKRRLDESVSGDDGTGASTFACCFFKEGCRPMPFACMLPGSQNNLRAAIINGMFLTIDAGGFAFGSTKPASITFRSIDTDLK